MSTTPSSGPPKDKKGLGVLPSVTDPELLTQLASILRDAVDLICSREKDTAGTTDTVQQANIQQPLGPKHVLKTSPHTIPGKALYLGSQSPPILLSPNDPISTGPRIDPRLDPRLDPRNQGMNNNQIMEKRLQALEERIDVIEKRVGYYMYLRQQERDAN
ncbi:uncharacterized protein FTOL_09400 [Fusarium torulosum]|uniref:Uncharacterized protein n=1 Tax=Fusarium torulosum TaxID=33205 RepID=A0AAE8SKV7_9HYPO|nr:uncharacterized protein FTOL_09400 [Fusarium torulosum]